MKNIITIFITMLSVVILNACSIVNPYEEDFSCRANPESGKCVNTKTAYADALATESQDNLPPQPTENPLRFDMAPGSNRGKALYEERLYRQLAEIIEQPNTPIMVPPKLVRVLLLPYKGTEGELYMPRYTYLQVDEAQWVLDNGLTENFN